MILITYFPKGKTWHSFHYRKTVAGEIQYIKMFAEKAKKPWTVTYIEGFVDFETGQISKFKGFSFIFSPFWIRTLSWNGRSTPSIPSSPSSLQTFSKGGRERERRPGQSCIVLRAERKLSVCFLLLLLFLQTPFSFHTPRVLGKASAEICQCSSLSSLIYVRIPSKIYFWCNKQLMAMRWDSAPPTRVW